jgi:hypothetical protein
MRKIQDYDAPAQQRDSDPVLWSIDTSVSSWMATALALLVAKIWRSESPGRLYYRVLYRAALLSAVLLLAVLVLFPFTETYICI